MRTLLLLRHAKSSWSSGASRDFDRPLSSRGTADAPLIGALLASSGVAIDRVVCSTAVRARETAKLVLDAAKVDAPVDFTDAIYEASPRTLYDLVADLPSKAKTVMFVGHNPGFEALLCSLCREGASDASIRVPTCALACVELTVERWKDAAPATGTLAWFAVPRMVGGGPD